MWRRVHLVAVLAAGCSGPPEVTPRGGPAVRIERGKAHDAAPAPTPLPTGTARAWVTTSQDQLLDGPAAAGRVGDLRLENEHLAVIILAAPHRGHVSPTGGVIVDAAWQGGLDGLGEVVPVFDAEGRRMALFHGVQVAQSGETAGPAIVRASGVDAVDDQIAVDVDYLLAPGDHYVRVIVTVVHRGRSHYPDYALGHFIGWGALTPFVPGAGSQLVGQRTRSGWLGGDGGAATVVFAPLSGRLEAVHGRDWSLVVERRERLSPGANLLHEGQVYVTEPAGVASAARWLHGERRAVVGTVSGRVEGPRQSPVREAWVTAFGADGQPATRALSDQEGRFFLTAPPGRYALIATAPGRAPSGAEAVTLGAEAWLEPVLTMGALAELRYTITDDSGRPLPARLRLEGLGDTPTPALGPVGGFPAAGNEILTATGSGTHPVTPGRYRVVVTAGPDYTLRAHEVRLRAGHETRLPAVLTRVVQRPGWQAVDPHVHTAAGPTSSTLAVARVVSCLAAGLDAVVVTDEERVTDLGAVVPSIRAPRPLHVLRGLSVVGSHGERFAALPVGDAPVDTRGFERRADSLLTALRRLPGAPLLAVLRPRAQPAGYFHRFQFDAAADALPRGGFSLDFDLLEVGVAAGSAETDAALADWFGLLNRRAAVTPIGGSGAYDIAGEPCGLPRTLVRAEGEPLTPEGFAAALRGGDVVVSFGPMVDLQVDAVRPGGTAPAGAQHAVVVRVQAPPWARPERLELVVDGHVAQRVPLPRGDGPMDISKRLVLPGGGAWVVAVVDGAPRDTPAYARPLRPLAFTGAVRFASP